MLRMGSGVFQLWLLSVVSLKIHINHSSNYLCTTTVTNYKVLCIIVMYPAITMASRRLKTFVNLSCTSKGMQWRMTTVTNRMTQCVREVFNFISRVWWFVHVSVSQVLLYNSTRGPAAWARANITKNRIKSRVNEELHIRSYWVWLAVEDNS